MIFLEDDNDQWKYFRLIAYFFMLIIFLVALDIRSIVVDFKAHKNSDDYRAALAWERLADKFAPAKHQEPLGSWQVFEHCGFPSPIRVWVPLDDWTLPKKAK